MALRFEETTRPFSLKLLEFKFDRHPGTQSPRNFSSRVLVRSEDGNFTATGGAGYFDQVVGPGESIDLTVCLPVVPRAGRYQAGGVDRSD